jgi:hypothetical protein
MNFKHEHAIETYKSLISISTEAFKALQLLNGGAIVALLAFIGQTAPTNPEILTQARWPIGLFVTGLALGTFVYITAYNTQLTLHNENIGEKPVGAHKYWLRVSFVLATLSMIFFSLGAFSCLCVLSARSPHCPRTTTAISHRA